MRASRRYLRASAVPEVVVGCARQLDVACEPYELIRRLAIDDLVGFSGRWLGGHHDLVLAAGAVPMGFNADPLEMLTRLPHVLERDEQCLIGGGWMGFLDYHAPLGANLLLDATTRGHSRPLLRFYDNVLRYDAARDVWIVECLAPPDTADDMLAVAATTWTHRIVGAMAGPPLGFALGDMATPPTYEHLAAVEQAVLAIHGGDIFQANICTQLHGEFRGSATALFAHGVRQFQPDYAALVTTPSGAVVSFSPELFLRREGSHVGSAPIKGTRPRTGERDLDDAAAAALVRSSKDLAENVMIVDLVRNDLGRVANSGSVCVTKKAALEAHPSVWHLVSCVEAFVAPTMTTATILDATFPPGSVTGAPKKRVLEIIDHIERHDRGVYTGAVGFVSPLHFDVFNVAIRTLEIDAGRAVLGTGGGITADSNPFDEWQECLTKVVGLVHGLGGRVTYDEHARPIARATKDTQPFVFDTAKVRSGVIIDEFAHDERLQASLVHSGLESQLSQPLFDNAMTDGRLRRTVERASGAVVRHEFVPGLAARREPVVLRSMLVPDYDYRYKYNERRFLDLLEQETAGVADPLIVDKQGQIFETTRANIFFAEGNRLHTPVCDDHILPGITRRRVLLLAQALGLDICVGRYRLDELPAMSEVFLSGSIQGIVAVKQIDSTTFEPGPVTAALTTAYDRWEQAYIDDRLAPRQGLGATSPASPRRPPRTMATGRIEATRVLIIDNYDSFTFNLVHAFRSLGCEVSVVRNDEPVPPSGHAFDALVVSPGPGRPSDAGISLQTIGNFDAAGVPILGVCLGHQCIAEVFGASITTAGWPRHGRTSLISHNADGIFTGLPQQMAVGRYHSLVVAPSTIGPQLVTTARTDRGEIMAIAHRSRPIVGVQFHPESVLTDDGPALLRNFLEHYVGVHP